MAFGSVILIQGLIKMIAVVFSFRIVDAGYKGVSESVAGVEFVGDRGIRLFVITRVYLKLNISYLFITTFFTPNLSYFSNDWE